MSMKARGDGGSDITQVMDDKITIVGSNANIFPSCRGDGAARSKTVSTISPTQGILNCPSTYSDYEAIDNGGDHHGGSYTMVAMNRLSLDSGGGGISLNSGGNINLMAGGGLANIGATACTTVASNVVKMVGNEIITLSGPEIGRAHV